MVKTQLQRQVGSSLYERLALSRDKDEVMRLANEGQTIEKPTDILKNPLTLEFLGLKPDASYSESKLENAISSFYNLRAIIRIKYSYNVPVFVVSPTRDCSLTVFKLSFLC